MPISRIAEENKLNKLTLEKQYKESLSNFREWEKETNADGLIYPKNFGARLSIDEVALSNGELYTVLTNKEAKGKKGCLCALIKGTKAEVIKSYVFKVPVSVRFSVKEITSDLANNMDWVCRECFPNAINTGDRFHFQKIVSEAVQEIRIDLRRKAINEENELIVEKKKEGTRYDPKQYKNGDTKRQLLARGRYLLFKPQSKWIESQKERAEILFKQFPELYEAYKLSMYFRNIFETAKTRDEGKIRLHKWYEKVSVSEIPDLISAANSIENHEGKILNYLYNRETNASAESFNAKLKGFRALLRGVSDIKFFLFRIEKLFA